LLIFHLHFISFPLRCCAGSAPCRGLPNQISPITPPSFVMGLVMPAHVGPSHHCARSVPCRGGRGHHRVGLPDKIRNTTRGCHHAGSHYMRKAQLRCACTKNGDTQITCIHHHVSHYRVIQDARLGESLISIHWRRAKLECVSHSKTHLRHALSVSITDLIAGWGPVALIRDAPRVRVSLITNKSEMRFILGRRRFSCRLGSLWH
jgi:hypothetical protein